MNLPLVLMYISLACLFLNILIQVLIHWEDLWILLDL